MSEIDLDLQNPGLSIREVAGVVQEVVRTHRIEDYAGVTAEDVAKSILDDAGLPKVGDELTFTDGSKVFLETRDIQQSDGRAYVVCTYRRRETDPVFRGGVTLETIETELDSSDQQITVEHQDVVQGGSVSVLEPRPTLEATLVEATSSPGVIAATWTGRTNNGSWNGGAAGTWACVEVTFEPIDEVAATPVWRFTYRFEKREAGWDPTVVFIDPETGRPAVGVTEANGGIKTVTWYTQIDFSSKFP